MNEEQALLRAIFDNPEEDTPRLVYADWLDENDRPVRAEAIRLGVAFHRSTDWSELHAARDGLDTLHKRYGPADLLGCAPGAVAGLERFAPKIERGFVSEVRMHLEHYEDNRDWLFRDHPIVCVHLVHRFPLEWPRQWSPKKYAGKWGWNLNSETFSTQDPWVNRLPLYLSEDLACHPDARNVDVGYVFFLSSDKAKRAAAEAAATFARRCERDDR